MSGTDPPHLRDYDHAPDRVRECYRLARIYQTPELVVGLREKYRQTHGKIGIWELLMKLDQFVDLSDPDLEMANLQHAFQTAEAMRRDGLPEWWQVTGLIHDLGKIIFLIGCPRDGTSIDTQWAVVGDTFVTGGTIPDTVVYPEFNHLNRDHDRPLTARYEEGCGLDRLEISYGHDEYLYQLLKANGCRLPEEMLEIIRYHSFYAWHTGGSYREFETAADAEMRERVVEFNKYDLYTKSETVYDLEEMRAYYEPLLEKWIGRKLAF